MDGVAIPIILEKIVPVPTGSKGVPGASAYQLAVANGFVGTEAEWLESLEGEPGGPGAAATITVGTVTTGAPGTDVEVENVGTSSAAVFNFSIPQGEQGDPGSGGGGAWGSITGSLPDQADLQAALDGKAATAHTHAQSDVTGLTAALAGKADTAHTHAQSDVTGLASALAGKLDTSAAPELIRDTMGTALVAGTNITITVNDAGDTITLDATGGGGAAPEVRHSNDGTYDYTGTAPAGTAEGSSGWSVTRITLTSPPVVMTGTGTWTGRAGITYS